MEQETEGKYRKYPYKVRHKNGIWYAHYYQNGLRKRLSLHTRNERIAENKFVDLGEDLDRGILGFSLKLKPVIFSKFAHRF